MNSYIYGQDRQLAEWAGQIIGFTPRPDVRAIGVARNGVLRAVTLFDTFSECDCNIHIASDGSGTWLSKEFLIRSFAYPFVQCGLRRVTGLVPARNAQALRFDLHLGFQREGVMRKAMPDDDLIILGMLREECRFIPASYRR